MSPHHEITVNVFSKQGRKFLYMRFRDSSTGACLERTTGKTSRRDAEREAAKWETELREQRYAAPGRMEWSTARERYDLEHLAGLAPNTRTRSDVSLDAVERVVNPKRLLSLTATEISRFQAALRSSGVAEDTIVSSLAHLKAFLNWCKRVGIMGELPKFPRVHRAKFRRGGRALPMKGRPLTPAELEAMIAVVPAAVCADRAPPWQRYLRGMWASGLRLAESLELYWDRRDKLCIDFTGKFPMLHVPGELEKGNEDRLLPIAPEFAEFLQETPLPERTGPVFTFPKERQRGSVRGGDRPTHWWVSRVVSEIGRQAGIVVNQKTEKHASIHDFRRSFGERWARRVMPQVLKELMRHESIETTLRYYVGVNADATAAVLWDAHTAAKLAAAAVKKAAKKSANGKPKKRQNKGGTSGGTTKARKRAVSKTAKKQA